MPALICNALASVILRLVFSVKVFLYNDEKPGFQPPRLKALLKKAVVKDIESSNNVIKTDNEKLDNASLGLDKV